MNFKLFSVSLLALALVSTVAFTGCKSETTVEEEVPAVTEEMPMEEGAAVEGEEAVTEEAAPAEEAVTEEAVTEEAAPAEEAAETH